MHLPALEFTALACGLLKLQRWWSDVQSMIRMTGVFLFWLSMVRTLKGVSRQPLKP
jgi:hypothetical protein